MHGKAAIVRLPETVGTASRMVEQQVAYLLLSRGQRWVTMLGIDPLSAFILDVVSSAGMQHHPYRTAPGGEWMPIEAGRTMGRPVSGSAIAQSVRIPLTTVRRHVGELLAAGLVERRARGLVVAPSLFDERRLHDFVQADTAQLAGMLDALAFSGYAPARHWSRAVLDQVPPGVVERLIQTFALRALETLSARYDGYLCGRIVAVVVTANARAIAGNPVLRARYADDMALPPDELRVPVSVRSLAQKMELPFETVRRRVAALEQAGTVERREGGVIVPGRVLATPEYRQNSQRIAAHFEQLTTTLLSLAGVPARAL